MSYIQQDKLCESLPNNYVIENLFQKYKEKLEKYIFYLLPYEEDYKVQDLLQNIFLKLIEKTHKEKDFLPKIIGKEFNTQHYLYKIAKNIVIDYVRKKMRNKEIPESFFRYKIKTISEEKQEMKRFFESNLPNSIEDQLLKKETKECLYYFINSLKLEYREIIYLYYFDGLSIKEIAKYLKIEYGLASMRLQRARFRLYKLISNHCCVIIKDNNIDVYLDCNISNDKN